MDSSAFTDPNLPTGYAPFNVQAIAGNIYVCFAKQDPAKEDEVARPGLGFVDLFDASGHLLMSLQHGFCLDAPWAVVQAPADFGKFSNDILVGQFGSGHIAAFDPGNGNLHGLLRKKRRPLTIDGLWGLGFGNGANSGPTNTLYFAAGMDDESHGLFGSITASDKPGHGK